MNYIKNFDELKAHILKCFPNEGGGIVTHDGVFIPLENEGQHKEIEFEISTEVWANYEEQVRCIVHSHTYDLISALTHDPRIPSKADMIGQISTNVEWAIVVTNGEEVSEPIFWGDVKHRPPLMERDFIFNVNDCLSFMRDWQYQNVGVILPDLARDWNWNDLGENHFEVNFESWGFYDVTNEPEKVGDVVFMKIQCDVVNHIGVIEEPGVLIHHPYNRQPQRQLSKAWSKYITRRIRLKPEILARKGE